MNLLDVHDLVVQYPVRRGLTAALRREPRKRVRAVDGVSLSVGPGEMLALIGESGCGKTSTAQAVLRMVDTTSGRIEVGGRDITHLTSKELRPIRRTMQMVYQDPYESLDPRFRVRRAIEEPLLIHGMTGTSQERARGSSRRSSASNSPRRTCSSIATRTSSRGSAPTGGDRGEPGAGSEAPPGR